MLFYIMDIVTSTTDLCSIDTNKVIKENILLEIIKEICSDSKTALSQKLIGKVNRIIADCDLTYYSSFQKLNTANESASTVLGFMHQSSAELTFDEQVELNQAIVNKIQVKVPIFSCELEQLRKNVGGGKKSRNEQINELQKSLDDKLNTLNEQENEKVELMMEWLNHRMNDVSTFSSNSNELLTIKTRILKLKSKILHLQILWNIFTETNQSIKAYSEIHKDLKDTLRETEERIKNYKDIIASDYS